MPAIRRIGALDGGHREFTCVDGLFEAVQNRRDLVGGDPQRDVHPGLQGAQHRLGDAVPRRDGGHAGQVVAEHRPVEARPAGQPPLRNG